MLMLKEDKMTLKEYDARLVDLNRRVSNLVETLKNHSKYEWLDYVPVILTAGSLIAIGILLYG